MTAKHIRGLSGFIQACLCITIIMKRLHGLILCFPERLAGVSRNAHCGTPLGVQGFLRNSKKFGKNRGNYEQLQPVNCNRITAIDKFYINYEILH